MKAGLILMVALTLLYVIVIVYANANTDSNNYVNPYRYVVYAACKHESDTPPSVWYTPEELGIVEIREVAESRWVQITVDRQKEPFPLQRESPILLYKDEFYKVESRYVTFDESNNGWQIPIGAMLVSGWTCIGVLFLRGRIKG
jgi:hypothetical protein